MVYWRQPDGSKVFVTGNTGVLAAQMKPGFYAELGSEWLEAQQFQAQSPHDTLHIGKSVREEISIWGFLQRMKEVLLDLQSGCTCRLDGMEPRAFQLRLRAKEGDAVLMQVELDRRQDSKADLLKAGKNFFIVRAVGWAHLIRKLHAKLDANVPDELAIVNWWFQGQHGIENRTVVLDKPKQAHDSFYPWVKQGLDAFFKAYLESDAAVLLLIGEPGTGKTSFLRWFIHKEKLQANISYDENVLKKDAVFINFMLDPANDLFIVEDADLMLLSREADENREMQKFLSVSDGMIKFPRKKLIFTTNLDSLAKVDSALLRPGRCFDILNFRKLTWQEAETAAEDAGVQNPQKACTLAELFNGPAHVEQRKAGF